MRRVCVGLLAATSLVALSAAAFAADLPRPFTKGPPPPPPPPIWSWTGFYLGAHGGGGWSTVESELTALNVVGGGAIAGFGIPVSSHGLNGFLGGVQAGLNWQIGVVVFGAEADVSATNIEGTGPCLLLLACRTETNWVATATGRIGVTADKALVYVKGGVAWAGSDYSASLNLAPGATATTSVSDTRLGAVLGTGVEYSFTPNWSAKIEYNYIDFGTETYIFPVTAGGVTVNATADVNQNLHIFKVGLNYRFGWAPPVYARY